MQFRLENGGLLQVVGEDDNDEFNTYYYLVNKEYLMSASYQEVLVNEGEFSVFNIS